MAMRTIVVDKDFYQKMLMYLRPEERWIDKDGALVFYVQPAIRLCFRMAPTPKFSEEELAKGPNSTALDEILVPGECINSE